MDQQHFGSFCWNELATADVKLAKDFYGKLFGWEFLDHKMGDMNYTVIQSGDKRFAGIWEIPANQTKEIPPHWMGYILVENLEKTLKKATEAGATIKMPLTKAGDFGLFAIIIDPTGAHIAFWENVK